MSRALFHGLHEGHCAARLAAGMRDRLLLRHDFLFSRLLKFIRWPGYNRTRQVTLRGWPLCYRFNRGDLQSLREVVIEEVYACDLPFQPATVLDLGANIGLFSVWMHQRCRSGRGPASSTQIIAVEPVPENAAVARVNFTHNQVSGQVIEAAVAQQGGEAWFDTRSESNLGNLASAPGQDGQIRVPLAGIRQLLDLFPGGKADLVKMDIEGAEGSLLSGATDWLERVRALLVEWHDEKTPSAPLIEQVIAAGFAHQRINASRQENLSLLVRAS